MNYMNDAQYEASSVDANPDYYEFFSGFGD